MKAPASTYLENTSWQHKAALSIDEVKHLSGASHGFVYKAIADGKLRACKRGRRTIVLQSDFIRWLESFPAIKPKPSKQSAA